MSNQMMLPPVTPSARSELGNNGFDRTDNGFPNDMGRAQSFDSAMRRAKRPPQRSSRPSDPDRSRGSLSGGVAEEAKSAGSTTPSIEEPVVDSRDEAIEERSTRDDFHDGNGHSDTTENSVSAKHVSSTATSGDGAVASLAVAVLGPIRLARDHDQNVVEGSLNGSSVEGPDEASEQIPDLDLVPSSPGFGLESADEDEPQQNSASLPTLAVEGEAANGDLGLVAAPLKAPQGQQPPQQDSPQQDPVDQVTESGLAGQLAGNGRPQHLVGETNDSAALEAANVESVTTAQDENTVGQNEVEIDTAESMLEQENRASTSSAIEDGAELNPSGPGASQIGGSSASGLGVGQNNGADIPGSSSPLDVLGVGASQARAAELVALEAEGHGAPAIWRQVQRAIGAVRVTGDGDHEFKIRLVPRDLGSVTIDIRSREGAVAIGLVAETSAASDRLNQQRHQLMNELVKGGLESPSVDISHQGEGQNMLDHQNESESPQHNTHAVTTSVPADEVSSVASSSGRVDRVGPGRVDLSL